jgi:hypothetical protein
MAVLSFEFENLDSFTLASATNLTIPRAIDLTIASIESADSIRVTCEQTGESIAMHGNAHKLGFVEGLDLTIDPDKIARATARMTESEKRKWVDGWTTAINWHLNETGIEI